MIPELQKESDLKHSIHQIILLLIGFIVMYWLTLTEWDEHWDHEDSPIQQEIINSIE